MPLLDLNWSPNLAYAIGLIATDGCLSSDGRHLDLTSKDIQQIQNFKDILQLNNKIGTKYRGPDHSKFYYRLEFGNVRFYRFLLSIGLTPKKSLTLGFLDIPDKYFADFLRGCLDGDGNISLAKHPESQYLQLRLRFNCASYKHLIWLKQCIEKNFSVRGGFIYNNPKQKAAMLIFAKADSIRLLEFMYYNGVKYYLQRKYDYYLCGMPRW